MSLYHVTAHEAAAMLEAEKQGYSPQQILAALKRHKLKSAPAPEPANAK